MTDKYAYVTKLIIMFILVGNEMRVLFGGDCRGRLSEKWKWISKV